MTYHVKVGESVITLDSKDLEQSDILNIETDTYHVLSGNVAYDVRVLAQDGKTMTLSVNGSEYEIAISDAYDQLVDKMGLGVVSTAKLTSVKAPMPGLVLDIMVEPGQTIAEGDSLLILEAMKMENVLKATGEGIVKSIEVAKGDAVEKGQILIEME